jgi:hypothetical protein
VIQEWNIKPRNDTCHSCGKAFAEADVLFSRLTFGQQGYLREDCCAKCWGEPARQGALSVWKGVFRMPPPPPPEPLKKETAESLLRQLMETEDPSKRNTIFILAVMLERRRILAERDVLAREDGVKVRVYEHRRTGESFLIPDPGLRLAELEQVQEEVMALLGWSREKREPQDAPPSPENSAGPEESAGD